MQEIDSNFCGKEATKIFNDVCCSDTLTAEFYKCNEGIKQQHWEEISKDLSHLISTNDEKALKTNLRARYAEVLENTITANFYVKLIEKEREIISKFIFESNKEEQDEHYHQSLALNFSYSTILDSIIFLECDGTEESKNELKVLEKRFIENCQDYCDLLLSIARAVNDGGDISEPEKEIAKNTLLLKEGARKALAGEKILDN